MINSIFLPSTNFKIRFSTFCPHRANLWNIYGDFRWKSVCGWQFYLTNFHYHFSARCAITVDMKSQLKRFAEVWGLKDDANSLHFVIFLQLPYVLLVETIPTKAESRSFTNANGAPSVALIGTLKRLMLSADSWAIHQQPRLGDELTLVLDQDPFSWATFIVMATNKVLINVITLDGSVILVVITTTMSEWLVMFQLLCQVKTILSWTYSTTFPIWWLIF